METARKPKFVRSFVKIRGKDAYKVNPILVTQRMQRALEQCLSDERNSLCMETRNLIGDVLAELDETPKGQRLPRIPNLVGMVPRQ